jgi:DNA (cytosine-5)-methyltransferase 1
MRILDAQYFGVPQRRRRVFVVACLGDWRAPAEVLSLREGLLGHLETGGKKRKVVAADAGAGVEAGCWWDGGQVSQTLDAVLQKGQTMPEKNRFPAVLQPKPIVIDRAAFNQGINAQYEPHIEASETMDSLVARGPHAVGIPYRKAKRAQSTTDDETWVEGQVSNTINNFDLGDTRTTHAVVEPIGDPRNVCQECGNDEGAIFDDRNGNVSRLTHCMDCLDDGFDLPNVIAPYAVRRLTPVECERLQGFPDNWSRIPWKGKPETDCPDGPRYKACGNSMAVPVMRWIGEQIAKFEANSR